MGTTITDCIRTLWVHSPKHQFVETLNPGFGLKVVSNPETSFLLQLGIGSLGRLQSTQNPLLTIDAPTLHYVKTLSSKS